MTVRVRWRPPRRPFISPLQPAPRTAVLVPWFPSAGSIRVFDCGWCSAAANFAPEAIAGTLDQLETLAGSAAPTHAVIVVGRLRSPRLLEEERERLWQAYRVPVFEQIIGRSGRLLAVECEAHDGLHVESPDFLPAGEKIETLACACGRTTPRLVPAEALESLRRAATSAR